MEASSHTIRQWVFCCTVLLFVPLYIFSTELNIRPGAYSLIEALQQARDMRRLQGVKDVTINMAPGIYQLDETLMIRPEDSHTHFVAASGNVIISGGVKVTGWHRRGNLYVADVPDFNGRPLDFRQMWVNGKKTVRARDVSDFEKMYRIRSVDKQHEILWVPSAAVRKILKAPYPEMVLHEMWCIANLRIKSIKIQGDSAAISFQQPESRIQFMHPWPSPMVTSNGHNSAFYLTNALELLDEPGEWYHDIRTGKLYYMPRKGEDIIHAKVIVPAVEALVEIAGTPDFPVNDVTFTGITFSYATWMRPSLQGHVPLQAGMYLTEAYKLSPKMVRLNGDHKLDNQGWVGRPAASVSVYAANGVAFDGCTFEHLASTGLDYMDYTHGGHINKCDFKDVGGSGILAGSFAPPALEAHRPYDPKDSTIICSGLQITDNRITDVTNEDWGCVGIGAGYVRNISICNNEISEVSYTGISLGWGWTRSHNAMCNNLVSGNFIYHYAKHMYDTAGIYTLSAQPGTVIENNIVRDIYKPGYVHDPDHWFYLYTDEGSSYITVKNNWTPTDKYLKNANGPGNIWENNGPTVNEKHIKQ